MKLTKIAALGMTVALVLGTTATAAVAATTSGSSTTTCNPDTWPAGVQGQPARTPGVTIGHDGSGWHVRVTHNSMHDRVFSGEVATRGELVDVTPVKLEKNDYLKVGPKQHGLVFRFNNYGGTDGFDFNTRCAPALEFGFLSDGHIVPPQRIAIGANARHPARDPFLIKRAAA